MAYIHFGQRQIIASVIYFGPEQAGSGTNVRQLHRLQAGHDKSDLERVSDQGSRSWRFRYRPSEVAGLTDFDLEVQVASVPSLALPHPAHEVLLQGLDAVVFVADARAARIEDNLAALLDLEQRLAREGIDLGAIPVVVQVNHTDAPNARPVARVVEDLNPLGFPVTSAVARQGTGVVQTHDTIFSALMARLRDNLADDRAQVTLSAMSRAARSADDDTIVAHVASLGLNRSTGSRQLGSHAVAEIHLRPEELRASEPIHLVRSELRRGRLRVETVVRRADGTSRKLAFVLEAGGDGTPVPEAPPTVDEPPLPLHTLDRADDDLPGIWYGLIGTVGGMLMGALLYFLLFG